MLAVPAWFWFSATPYTKVINKNWGLELPGAGAREIYAYSEPSFHGDGIRYHVIDYDIGNESRRIQNTVWQLEKTFHSASQPSAEQISRVDELLSEINVEEDLRSDWKVCRLIYLRQEDNSELFLMYWDGTGTLYAVESFL